MKSLFMAFSLLATLSLTSSAAISSGKGINDKVLVGILEHMINNGTSGSSPTATRITTAVAATEAQVQAMGFEVDREALSAAARSPLAYAPSSDTSFVWGGASWTAAERSTYTYAGGKQNTIRTDNWTGTWDYFSLYSWSYNGSNQITSITYQTWDGGSSTWTENSRTLLTYDGSSRLSTSTTQSWDGTEYTDVTRLVYSYDGSGRVDTIATQMWLGFWLDNSRTLYAYDGGGYETSATTQLSQPPTYAWTNSHKILSAYDGSHHLTSRTRQNWNGSAWVNAYKNEFEFNGSGDETLDRYSTYSGSAWSVVDVDTFKYDGNHRITEAVHSQLTPFVQLSRETYTYDGQGNEVLEIDQTYSGTWQNTYKYVTVYTSLAVKINEEVLPDEFGIEQNSPNPFNPTTTIRYSVSKAAHVKIDVWNTLGQHVTTLEDLEHAPGVYETTWNGTNSGGQKVSSGVYFYTFKTDGYSETRKMVLLK